MNKRVKALILGVAFSLTAFQFRVFAASPLSEPKVNINTNKEWIVRFNNQLKPSTINNSNITVTDENNNIVPVAVVLGKDPSTVIISPKVSGYDPNKKYNLVIGAGVESTTGKKLLGTVKVPFTTTNKYIDGTSYNELPQIVSSRFEYSPLLSSQKQGFFLSTKNGENVQYRIFVHGYSDKEGVYNELTNGYVSPINGKITAAKTLKAGPKGEKYKVVVYVKRSGTVGAHLDKNTDYDNYYIDYFRAIDSINTANNTTVNYNISLDQMIDTQLKSSTTPVFVETTVMNNAASKNQIKYYVNPNNFLDEYGKYQFLRLNYSDGITADRLNTLLKGKGVLEGKGQVFLDAAKANNISVAYLVSHAILETGHGTSKLANGGMTDNEGKYIYGVPVYNFFGIGAYDSNANYYGTKAAYDNKWFTPEDAIQGGTKWIASRYINNPSGKQDTLYKMRWNPANPANHQYATDIAWAYKQIPFIMKGIQDVLPENSSIPLIFEIPQFK